MRGWFFIDFFSVLPISYVMLVVQETNDTKGAFTLSPFSC